MIRAAAIAEFDLIGNWEHEMLKYGQAIIHDKIVVIDPLSRRLRRGHRQPQPRL